MGNFLGRPWRSQEDEMKKFLQHENNCIRPLINLTLIQKEMKKMLEDWDSPLGGIYLRRDVIISMTEEAIAAAALVKHEASMAQAVQIRNKVLK